MDKDQYQRLFELEDRLWWFVGMRKLSFALIERFVHTSPPLSILDAGCGTGGMIPHLQSYGSVVGADLSDQALAFARRRQVGHLVQSSLPNLPFSAGVFDLVTSFDVIYHQAIANDEVALSELTRVLRPGGILLIRVPAHDRLRSRHDIAVHTRHRYAKRELKEKLERAGLEPLYLSYVNCFLFPVAAAARLADKVLPGDQDASQLRDVPPLLNRLLEAVLGLEASIIRAARLPFGLSLVAVARRKAS